MMLTLRFTLVVINEAETRVEHPDKGLGEGFGFTWQ